MKVLNKMFIMAKEKAQSISVDLMASLPFYTDSNMSGYWNSEKNKQPFYFLVKTP